MKELVSTFAKLFSGGSAEGVMTLIKRCQQANIFICIQTFKALIGALLPFNLAVVTVLFNQARNLLPWITGNFDQKAYDDAFWMLFQRGVSEFNQYALYASVTLILAAGNQVTVKLSTPTQAFKIRANYCLLSNTGGIHESLSKSRRYAKPYRAMAIQ